MMSDLPTNNSGFAIFGEIGDAQGRIVRLVEASVRVGCCWVICRDSRLRNHEPLLSVTHAKELRAALQRFIEHAEGSES